MKKIVKTCAFFLIFIFGVGGLSYCGTMDIGELVDNFQKATDLQKEQILKDNLGKEISAGGKVSNVGEYDFFDTGSDFKGTYYQVSTEERKTKNNVLYQLIFLFKDKDKVKDINKGEDIQKDGKIIRINDERLQISVWLLSAELTEDDKLLLKQN
ncbi:MAG: hypothetical protein PHC54_06075 [Candidatus Omnitrophica bacterium]|nr:hypothetical protein [Candidatus Omnitrophota bacterium]MDD5592763.1 hypothetical protein [Candidatus Omnitrophota bacterium]